jgi:thiol-disulfide isomerase/thioredoxin
VARTLLEGCLVAVMVGACVDAGSTAGRQFQGRIEPALTPAAPSIPIVCTRTSAIPRELPIPSRAGVFEGSTSWLLENGELRIPILLVEPESGGRPFLFVDADRDGAFSASERFSFSSARRPYARGRVRIATRPLSGSPFDQLPLELLLPNARLPLKAAPDERYLLHSVQLLVTARVPIDSRLVFFRYGVAPDSRHVDLRSGYQAVDDGRLDDDSLSPRRAWARGETLVFRIGNRYVSTTEVNLTSRTVTVQAREPSEYRRLELRTGLVVPDFGFEDLDGRPRTLAELRGRYVLLNFWYEGCGPCADEFPYLRAAEGRFGPRGLTIVGLSEYGTRARIRALAQPSGTSWVEATPESVRELVQRWFRITSTPTQILLDPAGRIAVLGRSLKERQPLRGAELLKTLDRILARSGGSPPSQ